MGCNSKHLQEFLIILIAHKHAFTYVFGIFSHLNNSKIFTTHFYNLATASTGSTSKMPCTACHRTSFRTCSAPVVAGNYFTKSSDFITDQLPTSTAFYAVLNVTHLIRSLFLEISSHTVRTRALQLSPTCSIPKINIMNDRVKV